MRRVISLTVSLAMLIAAAVQPIRASGADIPHIHDLAPGQHLAIHGNAHSSHVHVTREEVELSPPQLETSTLCLENKQSYCAAWGAGDTSVIISATSLIWSIYTFIFNQKKGPHGEPKGEPKNEEGEEDGSNAGKGECLFSEGGDVGFKKCGDKGTTWFLVKHKNGFYIQSAYKYDRGKSQVITVDAASSGKHLYLSGPGSGWQTWTWIPYIITGVARA